MALYLPQCINDRNISTTFVSISALLSSLSSLLPIVGSSPETLLLSRLMMAPTHHPAVGGYHTVFLGYISQAVAHPVHISLPSYCYGCTSKPPSTAKANEQT